MIAVQETYIRAVADAGGAPVLIPLGLPEEKLLEIVYRVEGILFTGGGDIAPERFGGEPHPAVRNVDPDRDRIEIRLAEEVVREKIPFLGICRGIQVINVALGGSLYTNIADQHPNALEHAWEPGQRWDRLDHSIAVESGSRLAEILGSSQVEVNSLHHQAIYRLAPCFKTSASAPDGIVEAFELPGHPFGLAVQWHPEWLQSHAPMRALFRAIVRAAEESPADTRAELGDAHGADIELSPERDT